MIPDPDSGPRFHAVLEGEAWLSIPGRDPLRLTAGDMMWIPTGQHHFLGSHADSHADPCTADTAHRSATTGSSMRVGFGPLSARLLSIGYETDRHSPCPSLEAFDEPVLLRADDDPHRLSLLGVLDGERADGQFGHSTAAAMITELFLVHLHRRVRSGGCTTHPDHAPAVHLDDVTRDSHALIHRHPERAWTSDSLAAAVSVSRATLHRHFAKSLGTTPMRYLAQWRMQRAAQLLLTSDEPIHRIASAVGYPSPQAFTRAFHRVHAVSPRRYRAEGPRDAEDVRPQSSQ